MMPQNNQTKQSRYSQTRQLANLFFWFVFLFIVALPTQSNAQFIEPEIKAVSAVVYDPISKTFIYEKNSDEVRDIASLVKILTAIAARDFVASQKYPAKSITLRKIDKNLRIDRELKVGETWELNDLLRFMLTTSSNTAAENIGAEIIPYESFISFMNFRAKQLGFTTLKAWNMSGLPVKKTILKKTIETPGAVASAKDIALLMAKVYETYPGLISYGSNYHDTFTSKLAGKTITRISTSTNALLATIPSVIGGKTGYTELAGGNLAVIIATPQNTPAVIVVLGSTATDRFADVAALASSTATFFTIK